MPSRELLDIITLSGKSSECAEFDVIILHVLAVHPIESVVGDTYFLDMILKRSQFLPRF